MSQEDREDMDTKFNRHSSVSPKGAGTENKKDNANNNQKCSRHNRHKDNGNRPYDNQTSGARRSQSSKARFVDKRPRPRGVCNGGGRDTVKDVERAEPEYGSVQSWGPKKNNLSHLLNFHFEPRDLQSSSRGGGNRGMYRGRGRGSRGPKFNKEHFLQANFQFVVKDTGDYSAHTIDPDVLVDWDLIEQIRIPSTGQIACPICLYPPTAAKITRCGHIYCWSCILHYLSLGEKSWRRCPICYDAVLQKDLKSAKTIQSHNYCVGETITLKLMKRMKGTTQSMPIDQWTDQEGKLYKLSDTVDTQYAKLLVVSPEEVLGILLYEQKQLEEQLQENSSDTLEGSYVRAALELLEKRQLELTMNDEVREDIEQQMQQLKLDETKKITENLTSKAKKTVVYSSAFSDEELDEADHSKDDVKALDVSKEELNPHLEVPSNAATREEKDEAMATVERSTSESSNSSTEPTIPDDAAPDNDQLAADLVTGLASNDLQPQLGYKEMAQELSTAAAMTELSIDVDVTSGSSHRKRSNFFYFYQAEDGQNIFLHSVNAQCLTNEYGALENCPKEITAKIVELQGVTMNEELRQRLRYLGHIPVTCEFQVAELALKPPIVSSQTLKLFHDKIERNRRQRQKKHREEKRFSRKIQEEENKKMGIDPHAVIVKSEAAFLNHYEPPTNMTDKSENIHVGSPTGSADADNLATSPRSVASSDEGGQCSMSFAQMLKAGKAKPQEAWAKAGSRQVTDQPGPREKGTGSDDGSDNEERIPVPGYKDSFGDAIQQALDKYQGSEGGEDPPATSTHATPTKKKKKTKTLLFTTTMNRAK